MLHCIFSCTYSKISIWIWSDMLQGKSLFQTRRHVSLPGWWFLTIPRWWLLPSSRWRLLTIFRDLLTPGWRRPFPLSWSLSCRWHLITCCVCVWIFTFYTWSFCESFKFLSPSLCYWNWNKMTKEYIKIFIKHKQAEITSCAAQRSIKSNKRMFHTWGNDFGEII